MKPIEMMGRIVTVTSLLRKWRELGEISYVEELLGIPRSGWFVGERNLRVGEIEPGSYEEPPCFLGKGNVKAYAVVFWPTMAPVLVPLGGLRPYRPGAQPFPDAPPWPPNGSPQEKAAAKACYQEGSGKGWWKRDPKTGRFQ